MAGLRCARTHRLRFPLSRALPADIVHFMDRNDDGLLIAFEGIDGAGKTTQVELLASHLRSAGLAVVASHEPTAGPWGRKIRASATRGRMSLADELHAFTEDRKEHVRDLIGPSLAAGSVVLLDRYFYSTIAYQGLHSGDTDRIALDMFRIAPTPDAVILLDVPAELGHARIRDGRHETPNEFEQIGNLRRARDAFLELGRRYDNVSVVDGSRPVESVRQEIARGLLDGPLKKKYCSKSYGCDNLYCSYRATGSCRWVQLCQAANLQFV